MLIRSLTFACWCCLAVAVAQAQDPPIEWGEIPEADLAMSAYPADTNAAAVILADFGTTTMNDDMQLVFERHLRVKVLSQRGFRWGEFDIPITVERDAEQLYDVEAVTYVRKENGDVEKIEFDDDDIIVEPSASGRVELHKFTLPGLAAGCVFELTYKISSNLWWLIRDWSFQHDEPIRWSEYRIKIPVNLRYAAVYKGYEPFAVSEEREENQLFSGRGGALMGEKMVPCKVYRWVVRDAPAIRDEPFITTREDYVNRVDVQLSSTSFYSDGVRQYMNTWDKFGEDLLKDNVFGDLLKPTNRVREIAANVTEGLVGQKAKARALYRWVQQSMAWDGTWRRYSQRDLDDIIASAKGSSAELNFVLIALLRSASIPAEPVLVSTRSNGRIQELYPIEAQFNHVIVETRPAGDLFYVDPVNRFRPFELPSVSAVNRKGVRISEKGIGFVTPTSSRLEDRRAEARLSLLASGDLRGFVEATYRDYAAVDERARLAGADGSPAASLRRALQSHGREWAVDSARAEMRDSIEVPLVIRAEVRSEGYATEADSLLYVNPHVLYAPTQSPLVQAERRFPLDYGTPQRVVSVVTIKLPEGFQVRGLVQNRSISSTKGNVEFRRTVASAADSIVVTCQFDVRSSEVAAAEYASVRELYGTMSQIFGESLVLERRPLSPPAVEPVAKKAKKK